MAETCFDSTRGKAPSQPRLRPAAAPTSASELPALELPPLANSVPKCSRSLALRTKQFVANFFGGKAISLSGTRKREEPSHTSTLQRLSWTRSTLRDQVD
eukprot:TRINITY_DN20542_c0_g1_i1.p1 TRINITY_DN20542_c0_g1~~TRINITY_DN20542_c0_g1_i1.p1  ORF type:complete len:100 (+),score=15.74 TRINITY_DN20542_c0_g1_i1:175-474(+)